MAKFISIVVLATILFTSCMSPYSKLRVLKLNEVLEPLNYIDSTYSLEDNELITESVAHFLPFFNASEAQAEASLHYSGYLMLFNDKVIFNTDGIGSNSSMKRIQPFVINLNNIEAWKVDKENNLTIIFKTPDFFYLFFAENKRDLITDYSNILSNYTKNNNVFDE